MAVSQYQLELDTKVNTFIPFLNEETLFSQNSTTKFTEISIPDINYFLELTFNVIQS